MSKPGPKSSASASTRVIGADFGKRAEPPGDFNKRQIEIWSEVVNSEPPSFFETAANKGLLAEYCRHLDSSECVSVVISAFKPEWLKDDDGAKRYHSLLRMRELETRAILSCATKLRITNQSRYTPMAAGTAGRNQTNVKRPWED